MIGTVVRRYLQQYCWQLARGIAAVFNDSVHRLSHGQLHSFDRRRVCEQRRSCRRNAGGVAGSIAGSSSGSIAGCAAGSHITVLPPIESAMEESMQSL